MKDFGVYIECGSVVDPGFVEGVHEPSAHAP